MDLMAITETWLNFGEKDNNIIKDLTPADYKFVHLPRKGRRGGVVCLVYRSSFKVVVNRRDYMKSFEFMDVDVSSSENSMKLFIIYRPPPSKKNKHSYADFLVDFTGFTENHALMTTRFAIVGDFNIPWDVPSDNNGICFESLNIIQRVHAPTHIDGHTIDLIRTPSGNHGITSTKTTLLLSDHLWVECLVDMEKPLVPRKTITYRKYKDIDKPAFCSDIASSLPTAFSSGKQTTTELANHYNVVLSKLIEKHTPQQTCRIADRPLVPWYNKNVIKAKQIRRQCERKWRHTSLQVHREIYMTQCAEVNRTIIKAKSDYFTSEIEQCGCDNRRLYRLLNGLLQRRKCHYLPVNNNIHELASRFSTFFSAKIEMIRVAFQQTTIQHHGCHDLNCFQLRRHQTSTLCSSSHLQHPACLAPYLHGC